MLAEKHQALPDIAAISLHRLRRQPPLGAQMRQPSRHLQRDVVGGAGEFDGRGGSRLGHLGAQGGGGANSRYYHTCLVYRS
jgi:hypothetical protein